MPLAQALGARIEGSPRRFQGPRQGKRASAGPLPGPLGGQPESTLADWLNEEESPDPSKVGLYYATGSRATLRVAEMVSEELGEVCTRPMPIRAAEPTDLAKFRALILGAPSYLWSQGSVSALDFDYIEPPTDDIRDLEGKAVAVFGTGDQVNYPRNFADAVGIVADKMEQRGAAIFGSRDTSPFSFRRSQAVRNGRFIGLVVDEDNEQDKTRERVRAWVAQLRKELQLE